MEPKKRLRPDQRIRKQEAFKSLVDKGNFERGEYFYLWAGSQDETGQKAYRSRAMLGVIVTRQVAARATVRNKYKRYVREIFRKHQQRLKPGIALLIKVKKNPKVFSLSLLEEDLCRLLNKAGAFK